MLEIFQALNLFSGFPVDTFIAFMIWLEFLLISAYIMDF